MNVLDFDRPDSQYVILGDYTDLSADSIHTLCYLLAAKCKHPRRVFLLDGPRHLMGYGGFDGFNWVGSVSKV